MRPLAKLPSMVDVRMNCVDFELTKNLNERESAKALLRSADR